MSYDNGNARLIRGIPVSQTLPTNGQSPTYSAATGEYIPGSTISVGIPVVISDGGTGQITAQAAIDALTQVAAATNEYVLTKDTVSGNALWKVAAASAVTVGDITGLGTGVATALAVNIGTAGSFVVNGGALGTPSSGTLTNCTFPTLNQNTSGYAEALKSATTTVSVSAATAPSIGQVLMATSGTAATWQTPSSFSWNATATGTSGTGVTLTIGASTASSTIGQSIILDNTQTNVSTLLKLDTGTSAVGQIGQLINVYNASSLARGIKVDMGTTGTGIAVEAVFDSSENVRLLRLPAANQNTILIEGISSRSENLTSRSTTFFNFSTIRENINTTGTVTDTYSDLYVKGYSIQNGVGGTLAVSGALVIFEHATLQAAGTLTSAKHVVRAIQSASSTGAAFYASTAGTGRTAFKFDTGFTTATAPTGASTYIIIDIGGTEYKLLAQATA